MRTSLWIVLLLTLFPGKEIVAQKNQIVLFVAGAFNDKDTVAKKCFEGQFLPICTGANTFDDLGSMVLTSVTVRVYSGTKSVGEVSVTFPASPDKNSKIKELVDGIKDKGYIYYEKPIVQMVWKNGEKELRTIPDVNIFVDEKKGRKRCNWVK